MAQREGKPEQEATPEVKHDLFWISLLFPGMNQDYDEVYRSQFIPANEELGCKTLTYVYIADICHKSLVLDGAGEQ